MTVTLELTTDTEKAIERRALGQGITTAEYLRRMVEKATKPRKTSPAAAMATNTQRGQTGAELLAERDALNIPPGYVAPANLPQQKTNAEILAELYALDMPQGYGDPAIDSHELARQLAARMSRPNREWRR